MYLGEINNRFGYATLRSEEEFEKFANSANSAKLALSNKQHEPKAMIHNTNVNKDLPILYQNIKKKPIIKSNAEIFFPGRYNKRILTIEDYLKNNTYTKASFVGRKYEDYLIKSNIMIPSVRERMLTSKSKYLRDKDEFFKFNINSLTVKNISPNNKSTKCTTVKNNESKIMRVMKVVYSSKKWNILFN